MRNISNKLHFLALGLALIFASYSRFWAAPLSAGVDVPQFWAFAKVFQLHGVDFYRYADASLDIFPTKGWVYCYPPVWLLILSLALLAAPLSSATASMVDSSWRLAMKTPIIAADLAIGGLLYWAVPGSKWRKLLFSCLWLLHPTAWYESAVYGQFDAIAAALLLASVILLEKGKDRLAFLLAGLAVLTKQHTVIPLAMAVVASSRSMNWRRLVSNCGITAGVVIIFSVPFLLTGNFSEYAHSLFLPGWAPNYQHPLMYAFSGSSALLTYLHDAFAWETSSYMRLTIPLLVLSILVVLILCYKTKITPSKGALTGFLVFLGLSYQVNYQYLIVFIPLALLAASKTPHRSERVFTIIMALLPAVWLWLFDVSFWFNYLAPTSPWVKSIFASLGLTHLGTPDYAFVSLSVAIMCLSLSYVVLTFVRWRTSQIKQPTMLPSSL